MNTLKDLSKQLQDVYQSAKSVNFVTYFDADDLPDCRFINEALPKLAELYAQPRSITHQPQGTVQTFTYEIKYVRPVTQEEFWNTLNRAFAYRGEYERSSGLQFTDEEEKKARDLQEAYKKIVKERIEAMPARTIYSFASNRWTFDLFAFVVFLFDPHGNGGMGRGDSFVIVGHYSD